MRRKGKEQVEKGNSPTKITWKGTTTKMKENSRNVAVDSNGNQKTTMGIVSRFGLFVCCSIDSSMTKPIGGVLAHLGVHRGWRHLGSCLWRKNCH